MTSELAFQMLSKGLGGLAIFLFGMKSMSEGMKAIAGRRMRRIIASVTDNPFMAVAAGIGVTFLLQSSSITTVLVVGFVNSGLMMLTQAIGVILGANIGTTITGWILALEVGKYGLFIIAVGVFILFMAKGERTRFIAGVIMGLGMIFYGLELMKNGFKPMRQMPQFVEWFSYFNANDYVGVLKCAMVGCVLTLIVQSSSATLGITMGLAATQVIPFETAAALVLGENLGTTITALLASIGAKPNAKRAAYSHVLLNFLGVAWVTAIFPFYMDILERFVTLAGGFLGMQINVMTKIAMVHTGFNLLNTFLFLPLIPLLAWVVTRIVPDKVETADISKPKFINDQVLNSPDIALELLEKEQNHLIKTLHAYVDVIRKEGSASQLSKLHNDLLEVFKEVEDFSTELVDKRLSLELSERVLQAANRQNLIVSIENSLFKLGDYLARLPSPDALNQPAHNFIEGLDAILQTATDTIESSDPNDVDILLAITGDKGAVIKKIHENYLCTQSVLELQDKSILLNISNLFERIVWTLHKLGLLMYPAGDKR
jgi:phosphate:Na+ symporter